MQARIRCFMISHLPSYDMYIGSLVSGLPPPHFIYFLAAEKKEGTKRRRRQGPFGMPVRSGVSQNKTLAEPGDIARYVCY